MTTLTGPTYTADQYTNNAVSTLAGGAAGVGTPLLVTDGSLYVAAGTGVLYPTLGPFPLWVTSGNALEIMWCTSRVGDYCHVQRGQEGTAKYQFQPGATISHGPTAQGYTNLWSHVQNIALNALDFNAKGDGATDDYAALQAAINAAGTYGVLYLPPRHYMISQSLVINTPMTILGGGEEFATWIEVLSTADPTYAIIVGQSADVLNVHLYGLTLKGRNVASGSTGGGVLFHAGQSSMKQCRVLQFGGDGIHIDSYTAGTGGQIFDVLLDDVYITQNGNSSNNTDNLYIGTGVYDSEFRRVIIQGGNTLSPTRGRYGINNNGKNCKFYHCHPYFCVSHGFTANLTGAGDNSSMVQIIGGEYETNGGNNIDLENIQNAVVVGVNCYGATGTKDILLNAVGRATVAQSVLRSNTTDKNLAAFNSYLVAITGNVVEYANAGGIDVDSGCTRVSVVGNVVDSAGGIILAGGQDCVVADNVLSQASIVESAGADYNLYHGNIFYAAGATITLVGAHSKLKGNGGTYRDMASGTASVASGQTSVVVTHGLSGTPARVVLTPTTDTLGARWWVSAKTSTTFTITLNATQASAISFDWRAMLADE